MKSTIKAPSAARVAAALEELGEMEEYIRRNLVVSYDNHTASYDSGEAVQLVAPVDARSDLLAHIGQLRSYLTVREGA